MSAPHIRAVVFGGGGPVGIAWQLGLVTGLAAHDVHLRDADAVIGTSAGAVAGATVTAGLDAGGVMAAMAAALPLPRDRPVDLAAMQAALLDATTASPDAPLAAIGRLALEADTVTEDDFVGHEPFVRFHGVDWPAAFACTGIDAVTGVPRVWTADDKVDLDRAVAASCAVPTLFPPVAVGGNRYVDGGMASPLNVHVAAGHERVLVVSCMTLALMGGEQAAALDASTSRQLVEIDALRDTGSEVVTVQPDQAFLDLSGWGAFLLDTSRVGAAYELGQALGAARAADLGKRWAQA
ncbi:patatin-like phospholipase family protein [Umezawaea sp. Da 62-37]|uniref:patatin-like phospholipase family protein n=1 Tax=Umezawaea sp. Da 62-37 TaxID=3075927 RepID=UPI0028F73521|nr:patatin-like phospholipase family protein [Umezawaea sp. Da 62-37]WNV85986.1 patatin-like phospholipase family protein [Umezawaea sp. Da 62-37]